MAIEKKFILVGISFLFGLPFLSTAEYVDLRISPDVNHSGLNSLKLQDFNETRVNRDYPRRIVHRRESYSFVRNNFDSNLRSYLREEKSRIGEILSRSREFERVPSRDFVSTYRRFRVHFVTKRGLSSVTERLERSNNEISFRPQKLTYDRIERIGRIERDEFPNLQIRDSTKPEFRFFDSVTRRFQRYEKNYSTDRRAITIPRRINDQSRTKRVSGRRVGTDDVAPRRAIRSLYRTYEVFFQQLFDWGATIRSKVDGFSNYLLTLIAGLFIFDTVGQMLPTKTEEKGFRNLLRNLVLVTGNTMVH